MDAKMMAAIVAAVQAYIEQEDIQVVTFRGQRLSPWKMGARREQISRRSLATRMNPLRTRLNRFSPR